MTTPSNDALDCERALEKGRKKYLGDGVYAEFDEFGITLTTENGIEATNTVYLEPGVIEELVDFIGSCHGKRL